MGSHVANHNFGHKANGCMLIIIFLACAALGLFAAQPDAEDQGPKSVICRPARGGVYCD